MRNATPLLANDDRFPTERFGDAHQPSFDGIADQRFFTAADVELDRAIWRAQACAFENCPDSAREALAQPHCETPTVGAD